mgnify:FL=1
MVLEQEIGNTRELVDYFIARFMLVPPGDDSRQMLVSFINDELGTNDILDAQSYMEDSLRLLLHLVLSQPEYQLG